ncbi:hypothetical protein JCM6882_002209 [Rhodosporidiobolus microsporus]
MAGVAGGHLAGEVHKAGGVGFIGGGHKPLDSLREEVGKARASLGLREEQEDLPLGVGLILWRLEPPCLKPSSPSDDLKAQGDLWLRYLLFVARVRSLWLSFSFGGTDGLEGWVRRVREVEASGAKQGGEERERKERVRVMVQVQTVEMGTRAREWDVDAVVVQGTESGGHGPTYEDGAPLSTLLSSLSPLYPFTSSPFLLAAGGLSSSSSIFSALSSGGAAAAVVGTAFEVASESLLPPGQKDLLVAASSAEATSRGIKWDIARDGANTWPKGVDGRAITNLTSEEEGGDAETAAERYKQAVEEKDVSRLVTWAGTGVGDVTSIRPARDIVRALFPAAQ